MSGSAAEELSECKVLEEEIKRIVSKRENDEVYIKQSSTTLGDGSNGICVQVWLKAQWDLSIQPLGLGVPYDEERRRTKLEALRVLQARIRKRYGIGGD